MFHSLPKDKSFYEGVKVLDPTKSKKLDNYQVFCGEYDADDNADMVTDASYVVDNSEFGNQKRPKTYVNF